MTLLRPRLRGLVSKLALFYALLSLPTLVVVESALLIHEFRGFMSGLDGGSLERAARDGAAELGTQWPHLQGGDATALRIWLDGWVLRFADGHTKRANSVNPIRAGVRRDLRDKVRACDALFLKNGIAATAISAA